jgi:hypothetical protein
MILFFTFQLLKTNIRTSGSGVFSHWRMWQSHRLHLTKVSWMQKVKKNERRRLCSNAPVGLARLQSATDSGALPFVFLKF